jgi:hypothetical protein
MKLIILKKFEGSIGYGPQTLEPGQVVEVEDTYGEARYWIAMGWAQLQEPESAAVEPPEKAVKKTPAKRKPRARKK